VAVLILAAINPDNTAAGYNWTFAYPMLLFIVIAGVLWYLFGRPHRRVPPQPISAAAVSGQPDASTARAAAVAGGLSVAAGGGTTESTAEAHGAHVAHEAATASSADSAAAEPTAAETPAEDQSGEDSGAHE
jgi:hypothetical protein